MALDFINLFRLWLDFLAFVFLFFGGLLLCLSTLFTPNRELVRLRPGPMIACGSALMVTAFVALVTCANKYNLVLSPRSQRCRGWTRQTVKEFTILMGPSTTTEKVKSSS
jgi:hypothetical protein